MFIIWSWAHSMWWGPDHAGYTPHIEKAGQYHREDAGDIVVGSGLPGRNTAVHVQGSEVFAVLTKNEIEEKLDQLRRL